MYETTLRLSEPAYLKLESADGQAAARIDVYEARRMLEEASRQPSEAARHSAILDYLSGKLGVARDTMAQNMALEFNDCIAGVVARINEDRKKKADSIASSLQSTPESPATSPTGQ